MSFRAWKVVDVGVIPVGERSGKECGVIIEDAFGGSCNRRDAGVAWAWNKKGLVFDKDGFFGRNCQLRGFTKGLHDLFLSSVSF
jgi:hypothetical protein